MKTIIIIFCLSFSTLMAEETAQLIPQYAQHSFPHEWYKTQLLLWKKEVQKEPKNAIAWYQIFKAQRYAFFGDTITSRDAKTETMKTLLETMGNHVPESPEYHLAMWRNGGSNRELYHHLEKAFTLAPNHPEIPGEMVVYHELTLNKPKRDFFIKKMYDKKNSIAPALMEYGYNVLMSLEKNAVLFVAGDNDTYPLWILQAVKGIRPDVLILNTYLFTEKIYHEGIVKKYAFKADESLLSDEYQSQVGQNKAIADYIKTLCERYTERPIYFGLTIDTSITSPLQEYIYITGLAQKYSRKHFDNIAILKHNWEKFRLDYLSLEYYTEDFNANAPWLPFFNMNYISPITVLYEHYSYAGDKEKAASLKEFALTLSDKAEQTEEVRRYFNDIDAKTVSTVNEMPAVAENDFIIKPNPAHQSVTIELPAALTARVVITDMRGNIVKEVQISGSLTLPTTDLQSGNYTVQFFGDFGVFSKNLVIAR